MTDPRATHHADQAAAAAAEAHDLVVAMALGDLKPGEWSILAVKPPPPWLREAIDRHNAVMEAGAGRACPHREHAGATHVINLAVWMPGYIACGPCIAAGAFDTPPEDAHRCDSCGKVDPPILLCAFQAGNIVIHWGQCQACAQAEGGHPTTHIAT